VQLEPALFDGVFDAGAELRPAGIAASLRQKRVVDLLDVNTTVNRRDSGCESRSLRAAASGSE
jgi:hypothetical protein